MKKLISIILTIASFAAMFTTIAANAADYQNSSYEIGLLNAISFLNEDGFSEEEIMTRSEFCGMICKLFRYENYSASEMTFKDIDETHPYYSAISALYAKGAIKGISKYSVAPNKKITLEEAGTIVVSALGYAPLVEQGLTTYTAKASELGLYDGIEESRLGGLTEETAITMMYNTLFAPIVIYEPDGDSISYLANKHTLMMNEIYDMYEFEGIVAENDVTSLYGVSDLQKGEIKIDDEIYKTNEQDISDLLGYAVKAYAIESIDNEEDTIIYAYPNDKYTNIVEIESGNIVNAIKTQIDYEDGSKTKKAKLSKAADVVYNGIGLESYENQVLNPVYGSLKLLDNDGDEVYDVVFVTEYDFYMVQSAAMDDREVYIFGADGNTLKVDLENVDCIVDVWVKDDKKDFSVLKSGTAVMAIDSGERNGIRLMDFYVLTDKVTGILQNVNSEDITIDNTSYEVAPFLDVTSASKAVSKNISCYIDIFGRAVYAQTETSGSYGFLYKAYLLDDETVQVQILETNNEWKKYNLKEKVRCNANSVKAADMLDKIKGKELVRYVVNDDGLISRLDTAMYQENEAGEIDAGRDATMRDAGYFRLSLAKKNRRFAHQTKGLFDGQGYNRWVDCFFPSQLYVLVRPDGNDIQQDQILWYTAAYFKTDYDYVTEVYDLTADNCTPLVMVYGDSTAQITDGSELVMADRIAEELDEDDMIVKKLYAWQSGSLKGFKGTDDDSFYYKGENVKRGDLFRIATDFNGDVEYVESKLAFRVDSEPENWFTDKTSAGPNDSAAYGRHQIAIGRVSEVNGDLLRIKVKDNQYINTKLRDATYYYIYDESTPKQVTSKGTRNDLRVGDVVVTRQYFGRLDQVYIYKNL